MRLAVHFRGPSRAFSVAQDLTKPHEAALRHIGRLAFSGDENDDWTALAGPVPEVLTAQLVVAASAGWKQHHVSRGPK